MDKKLRLEIVTPDRIVYSDDIASLVVRSVVGELGILYNHAPLIATLKEYPVKLNMLDGQKKFISVAGGFMEVKHNKITILTPAAELPEGIDKERAEAAKSRAEQRIKDRLTDKDIDVARAEAALHRAIGRLMTLESGK